MGKSEMNQLFSIIVTSLNPGEKLIETLASIEKQTFTDYEVVVKDGGSKDGSLQQMADYLTERPGLRARVHLYEKPDKSIYDGMNQAVEFANGEYLYFLNCGDTFHDEKVLTQVAEAIRADHAQNATENAVSGDINDTATTIDGVGEADEEEYIPGIFYGNIYDMLQKAEVASNPKLDAFACYRNVPCHQACFYHASLFEERGYRTEYKVRGDYEHFLWCFFKGNAKPVYVPVIIADYEGGGYSETRENIRRSKAEHKEITSMYMSRRQLFMYKLILALTLAPVRTYMAHNRFFAGAYNRVKQALYGSRK